MQLSRMVVLVSIPLMIGVVLRGVSTDGSKFDEIPESVNATPKEAKVFNCSANGGNDAHWYINGSEANSTQYSTRTEGGFAGHNQSSNKTDKDNAVREKDKLPMVVGCTLGLGITAALISAVIIILCCRLRWRRNQDTNTEAGRTERGTTNSIQSGDGISNQELAKQEATTNANELGSSALALGRHRVCKQPSLQAQRVGVPEDLTPSVICSNNDSGIKPFFGYEERKDQSVQSEPDSDLSQPFDCHTPSTPQNVELESSDDVGKVPRVPSFVWVRQSSVNPAETLKPNLNENSMCAIPVTDSQAVYAVYFTQSIHTTEDLC